MAGGETQPCFILARIQLCTIQEGEEGVKTRGGRVLLGYGGSREGAGIVDVKSRTSLRRGESPSKAARGPASWKSKLWAKAVCAAWVRRADHRAMNAWAVAWHHIANIEKYDFVLFFKNASGVKQRIFFNV